MADLFARLKFEVNGQQALESAKQSILQSGKGAKEAGKSFTELFDELKRGGELSKSEASRFSALASTLGSIQSTAKTTKGQIREFTEVITELTVRYRALSEEDKRSPIGRSMAQSIAQLTERAGAARDALADVQASINNSASDTRAFDQMTGAMTTASSAFQVGAGAAKLLGIDLGNNVEVLAKLQAAMAITNGLQVIQNNLQKQSALMQGLNSLKTAAAATAQGLYALATRDAAAAQTAFNVAADANPYGAILAVVGLAAGAVAMFASNTSDANDEQKKLTVSQKAAKKEFDEINKTVAEACAKYSVLQIQWNQLSSVKDKNRFIKEHKTELQGLCSALKNVNDVEKFFSTTGTANFIKSIQLRAQATVKQKELIEQYEFLAKAEREHDEGGAALYRMATRITAEQIASLQAQAAKLESGYSGYGETTTSPKKSPKTKKEKEKKAINTSSYTELQVLEDQLKTVKNSMAGYAMYSDDWKAMNDEAENLQKQIDKLNSKPLKLVESSSLSELQLLEDELQTVENSMKNAANVEEWKEMSAYAKKLREQINALSPSDDDNKTGVGKQVGEVVNGVSSIASNLEQLGIDVPEGISKTITVVQTICAIMSTVASLTAIIAGATAAKAVPIIGTFLAGGGVVHAANGYVPGNYTSGDQVPAMLNSGELVLNKAQQGNLASQLGGGVMRNARLETYIDGKALRIVLNNDGQYRGKGTLVTSKG